MSVGLKLLRACIEHTNESIVRKASSEFFLEEERPVLLYVKEHLDTYGALPTADEVTSAGHPLSTLRQSSSPDYYYDLLRKRFAYSEVNERHPRLVESMRSRDTDGVIEVLSEMLQEARRAIGTSSFTTISDELVGVASDYLEAKNAPGLRGVPTGWDTLDEATCGLMGGDLVVIAGRPSMGKSWLLMEMAYAASRANNPIAFISMEMGMRQIARRWLGRSTRINPNFIRSGEIGSHPEQRMMQAIDSESDRSPVHLLSGDMKKDCGAIEEMVLEFTPSCVYVDAAYLLSPSGRKMGYISRWESISEVIRELKQIAIRYDIPVVASVQFNRNQKNKSKKSFDLGDIAGSDSIPQDASIVLGVRDGASPNESTQRIIEVMKNREGESPRFATAFTFTPVDLSEVPLVEDGQGGEGTHADSDYIL